MGRPRKSKYPPLPIPDLGKMSKVEAQQLIEESLTRFKDINIGNARGHMSLGGVYWRLARVLRDFCEPNLEDCEGYEHAAFITDTHGLVRVIK